VRTQEDVGHDDRSLLRYAERTWGRHYIMQLGYLSLDDLTETSRATVQVSLQNKSMEHLPRLLVCNPMGVPASKKRQG
jgi:hypothetical protein